MSPRCSMHVICKKEKIKRFFCGFLKRWRKNEGICSRQQNATGVCRVSCPASTPARLAVSPAGNTVTPNIPRQPASSPPRQPAIIFCQPSFFTEQISAFPYPTPFLPACPANTPRRQSFYIGIFTTFLHPTHSNSRQVSPAGCQFPHIFTSFLLSFCECFSFFKKRRNFLRRFVLWLLF